MKKLPLLLAALSAYTPACMAAPRQITAVVATIETFSESGDGYIFRTKSGKNIMFMHLVLGSAT